MKRNWFSIIAGVLLVLLLVIYVITFQVRYNEWAVVTRFGKISRVVKEPGIRLKWFWPIDKVHKFDKRIQVFEDSFEETLTKDQKNVIISAYVGWRVAEPLKFLESVKTSEKAVKRLRERMRSTKNTVFTKYDFSQFVSTVPDQMMLNQMEDEILAAVQKEALSSFGIEVKSVGIKHLSLPQSASAAVFAQMKERRQLLASRYLTEGETKALEIREQAEADKRKILAFAQLRKDEILAEGEAAAQKFYSIQSEAPEFAAFLRGLEFVRTALKQRSTFFFNAEKDWFIRWFKEGAALPPRQELERLANK